MPEWYEVNNPVRFFVITAAALAVGFGGGWVVHRDLHDSDAQNAVCERMTWLYQNKDLMNNLAYDDWQDLKETYGEDAASAIMDARYSGGPMLGAILAEAVKACGEAPSSN